jgi:hypothetical protein
MPAPKHAATRRRGAVAAVALALVVAGGWSISTALSRAGAPPCFVADWRQAQALGDLAQPSAEPFTVLLEHAPDRLQIVSLPPLGTHALRVDVEPGDSDQGDSAQRTELAAPGSAFGPGTDVWVATSVYLPVGFPLPRPGGWALFAQLFGESGGASTGSPPIALEVTPGGRFRLTVRGGSKSSSSDPAPREVHYRLGRVAPGGWHDFLLHIRLAGDSSGFVEAWHRRARTAFTRKPLARDQGPNVLTVGGIPQAVFPEVGYYRSADARPGWLYTIGFSVCPNRTQAERLLSG